VRHPEQRLIGFLRQNVPHATVLQGEALNLVQALSFDVLIGNLPYAVTETLLALMPRLSFRVAVLAVSESADLDVLGRGFSWSEVTRTTGDDFLPPQPSVSRIVRVVPGSLGSAVLDESAAAADGDHEALIAQDPDRHAHRAARNSLLLL
jgi:hypothetical protein